MALQVSNHIHMGPLQRLIYKFGVEITTFFINLVSKYTRCNAPCLMLKHKKST